MLLNFPNRPELPIVEKNSWISRIQEARKLRASEPTKPRDPTNPFHNPVYNLNFSKALTDSEAVRDFASFLKSLTPSFGLNEKELQGLKYLTEATIENSNKAKAPISDAHYSATAVFNSGTKNFKVWQGANRDPLSAQDLKDPQKRNCAERVAFENSAPSDKLDLLFLFRNPRRAGKNLRPEKFVPCNDCAINRLARLSEEGKLILVFDDRDIFNKMNRQSFFTDGRKISDHRIISYGKAAAPFQRVCVILNKEELDNLKIEAVLGANNNGGHKKGEKQVISFKALLDSRKDSAA